MSAGTCWHCRVLKQRSFENTLGMLKRGISVMSDGELMQLFEFFWKEKSHIWNLLEKGRAVGFFDVKGVKSERKMGILVDICWSELVKRGCSIPLFC